MRKIIDDHGSFSVCEGSKRARQGSNQVSEGLIEKVSNKDSKPS